MRCHLAQIAAFLMACPAASSIPSLEQSTVSKDVVCPSLQADKQQRSGPEISIVEVRFSGALQLPVSDQEEIATSIKAIRGSSVDSVRDEALERVKQGWQNRGYLKAEVRGELERLVAGPASQRVGLNAYVDEGLRYRLGEITFKGNKAIPDSAALRNLIPMKDGEIFSREKMAKGIENLRKAYGEAGYLNYTGVPDTEFDDESKIINIHFYVDEGKEFFISSIKIVGLDEHSQQELLKDFQVGQIYNQRLFDLFIERNFPVFKMHHDDPRLTSRQLDEKKGTIAITLYACPCPVC